MCLISFFIFLGSSNLKKGASLKYIVATKKVISLFSLVNFVKGSTCAIMKFNLPLHYTKHSVFQHVELTCYVSRCLVDLLKVQQQRNRWFVHILFLTACLTHTVVPKFIATSIGSMYAHDPAVKRKTKALQMELVRVALRESKLRWTEANRLHGYAWLNWHRCTPTQSHGAVDNIIYRAFEADAKTHFGIHLKKWANLSYVLFPYILLDYVCDFEPAFHCANKFSNCERLSRFFLKPKCVPFCAPPPVSNQHNDVLNFISHRAPNHCLPNKIDRRFLDEINVKLERAFLCYRWRVLKSDDNIADTPSSSNMFIPFSSNAGRLPPLADSNSEFNLKLFKNVVFDNYKLDQQRTKYNTSVKNGLRIKDEIMSHCKSNNSVTVASDKTARTFVVTEESLDKGILDQLNNQSCYKAIDKSRSQVLDRQATNIVKATTFSNFSTAYDLNKLKSSCSQPAQISCNIKDHKAVVNGQHPLRLIASVHGTAVDKIDWYITKILTQCLLLIPTHLDSTEKLLESIDSHNAGPNIPNKNMGFISLDVVSLYPSIPCLEAIIVVVEFIRLNLGALDMLGLDVNMLQTALTFICFNYEVRYKDKTFLQISGVPMGARFAPPFAIIFMYSIEREALARLNTSYDIFFRYIDDIIIGPINISNNTTDIILETFNSINEHIQFTSEKPNNIGYLPFLDVSIKIYDTGFIEYTWYKKSIHSDNGLHMESCTPMSVKLNYLDNRIRNVERRCNTENAKCSGHKNLEAMVAKNGFNKCDLQLAYKRVEKSKRHQHLPKKAFNSEKHVIVKLPFTSESCLRKIKQHVSEQRLPFKIITTPGIRLSSLCTTKHNTPCEVGCEVCDMLPSCFNCKSKFVVYQFTCNLCGGMYIGKTAVFLINRYKQHKNSIASKNESSALSQHLIEKHANAVASISQFTLKVLRKYKDNIDVTIAESMYIQRLKPNINRKFELTMYNIDYHR